MQVNHGIHGKKSLNKSINSINDCHNNDNSFKKSKLDNSKEENLNENDNNKKSEGLSIDSPNQLAGGDDLNSQPENQIDKESNKINENLSEMMNNSFKGLSDRNKSREINDSTIKQEFDCIENNSNLVLENINQFKTIVNNNYAFSSIDSYQYQNQLQNNYLNNKNLNHNERENYHYENNKLDNSNENDLYSSNGFRNKSYNMQEKNNLQKGFYSENNNLEEYLNPDDLRLRDYNEENSYINNQEELNEEFEIVKNYENQKLNIRNNNNEHSNQNNELSYHSLNENLRNLEQNNHFSSSKKHHEIDYDRDIKQISDYNSNENIINNYHNTINPRNEVYELKHPNEKRDEGVCNTHFENLRNEENLNKDDLLENEINQRISSLGQKKQDQLSQNSIKKNQNKQAEYQINEIKIYENNINSEREPQNEEELLLRNLNARNNNVKKLKKDNKQQKYNREINNKESEGDNSLLRSLEEKWEKIEEVRKQKQSSYNRKNYQFNNNHETINHVSKVLERISNNNNHPIKNNNNNRYTNNKSNENFSNFNNRKNFFTLENSVEIPNELSSKEKNAKFNQIKFSMLDKSELSESVNNYGIDEANPNKQTYIVHQADNINQYENNNLQKRSRKNFKETFQSLNNFKDSSDINFHKNNNYYDEQLYKNESELNFERENYYAQQEDEIDQFIKEKTEILQSLKDKGLNSKKINKKIEDIEEEITNEDEAINTNSNKEKENQFKKYKASKEKIFSDLKTNTRALIDKLYNEESINSNSDNNENEIVTAKNSGITKNYVDAYSKYSLKDKRINNHIEKPKQINNALNILIYEPNLSKNKNDKKSNEDFSEDKNKGNGERLSFLKPLNNNIKEKQRFEDKNYLMGSTLCNHINQLNQKFLVSKNIKTNENMKNAFSYDDNNRCIFNYNNVNTKNSNSNSLNNIDSNNNLNNCERGETFGNKTVLEQEHHYESNLTKNSIDITKSKNQIEIPKTFLNNQKNYTYDKNSQFKKSETTNQIYIREDPLAGNNIINYENNLKNDGEIIYNNNFYNFNRFGYENQDDIDDNHTKTLGNYDQFNENINENSNENRNDVFLKNNYTDNCINNIPIKGNSEINNTQNLKLKEKIQIIYDDISKLSINNETNKLTTNDQIVHNSNLYHHESNTKNNKNEFYNNNNNNNNTNDNFHNTSNTNNQNNAYESKSLNYSNFNAVRNNSINKDLENNNGNVYTLQNLEKNFKSIFAQFSPKIKPYQIKSNDKSDLDYYNINKFNEKKSNLNYLNEMSYLNKQKDTKNELVPTSNLISPSAKNNIKSFNSYYNDHLYNKNFNSIKNSSLKESILSSNYETKNRQSSLNFRKPNNIQNGRIISKINHNLELIDSIFDNKRSYVLSPDVKRSFNSFGQINFNYNLNVSSNFSPTVKSRIIANNIKSDIYKPNMIYTNPKSNSAISDIFNDKNNYSLRKHNRFNYNKNLRKNVYTNDLSVLSLDSPSIKLKRQWLF